MNKISDKPVKGLLGLPEDTVNYTSTLNHLNTMYIPKQCLYTVFIKLNAVFIKLNTVSTNVNTVFINIGTAFINISTVVCVQVSVSWHCISGCLSKCHLVQDLESKYNLVPQGAGQNCFNFANATAL